MGSRGGVSTLFDRRDYSSFGGGIVILSMGVNDTPASKGITYSRTGPATYDDVNRVIQTAATGVIRNNHWEGGHQYYILENRRTNVMLWSEDLTQASYAKLGATPTTIGGSITAPDGSTNVKSGIIGGNGAFTDQGINNAFTLNWSTGVRQCFSTYYAPGNKSNFFIESIAPDNTVVRSWANATTGVVGTVNSPHILRSFLSSSGFWRFKIAYNANAPLGATPVKWRICPCDADNSTTLTGNGATVNGYSWGRQAEQDQGWCTSYMPTNASSFTRNEEVFDFPMGTVTPQAITLYVVAPARGDEIDGFTGSYFIGSPTGTEQSNCIILINNNLAIANSYGCLFNNQGTGRSANVTITPTMGDVLEYRGALSADITPIMTIGVSINGGAESIANTGAGAVYGASWDAGVDSNFHLVSSATVSTGVRGQSLFSTLKLILGNNTLAQCRIA